MGGLRSLLMMDTIFFILSKVVQFGIEPLNWALLFILLSVLFLGLRKTHLVKRFLLLGLIDLLVVGYLPTSELPLRFLEDLVAKSPLTSIAGDQIGAIVILGGAVEGGLIGPERGEVSLEGSAERVTKGLELMRTYPNTPFIYSGFSGKLVPRGISEADAFRALVHEQGLEGHPGYYENQSRNTYENVLFIKQILKQIHGENKAIKPVLLITSASHMYRSIQLFQKQEMVVIPVPVDYQTGTSVSSIHWGVFDLTEGSRLWNRLLHELIGLAAYWVTGKL